MKVYVNRIDGIDDAIISMYLSKRTLTRELEMEIRQEVLEHSQLSYDKSFDSYPAFGAPVSASDKLRDRMEKLCRFTVQHITLLRFIDLSFTVYGFHRAGQYDLDAHAMRMNNRIIRSSTRLADFSQGEVSGYYANKILPTDVALAHLGITTPEEIEYEGRTYVRAINGYIVKVWRISAT